MPKRLLVYTITVAFSVQYIVGAVPIFIESAPPIEKEIFIPESYGVIEKSSFDKYLSSRFVVLLKDAHCNYDAQHNIARILEVLVRDYKIDLVAVEGAVGFLDYARLEKLENETAREKMADSFVKKGILTGPEYLKITKDGRLLFNIYGIEDEKLYIENFIAFRQTIDYMEETFAYINELDRVVKNLKRKIYPEGLLEFDNKSTQYYENTISLTDWVKELKLSADKSGMTLKEYPNILITLDSIELEEKIDFKKVELERAEAIGTLEKILSQEELKEMVTQSLQFRLGKVSSRDYYKYLEELLGPEAEKRYPNLTRYIQLVKFQSWINNDALFSEIEILENTIKETMFQNNVQRQLNDISKKTRILNGLFKLTLTREDIGYYRAHRAEFLPSNMLSFINIQAPLHNIPVSMLLNDQGFLDKVSSVILDGEKFYDIAIQRDVNLVENTLRVMEEKQKSSAVMVIGGFHTDGVVNLFEEKGVGYVVISPKIVMAEKEGLYLSLMMDKRIQLPQEGATLAFIHPLAEGAQNERLLDKLRARRIRDELFKAAMLEYHKYLREYVGEIIEERVLPFNISVDPSGKVSVEIDSGYRLGEETNLQLEWFRQGLEGVLSEEGDLRDFVLKPGIIDRYLDRSAVLEYTFRAGTPRRTVLENATKGFIRFYLGLCKIYEDSGWFGVRNELKTRLKDFLPKSIQEQESGGEDEWPGFKKKMVTRLIKRAREGGLDIDEDSIGAIVNYLLKIPAYGMDEKGEFYQTLFFSSYLDLAKDVFGVEKDIGLKRLFDNLQAYRFLQVYLGRIFEVKETMPISSAEVDKILKAMDKKTKKEDEKKKGVELLARYLSGERFDKAKAEVLERIVRRERALSDWEATQWIRIAGGVTTLNEESIQDPLKRGVYVAALSGAKLEDVLDASDDYMKKKEEFVKGLDPVDKILARLKKGTTFVGDISLHVGEKVKGVGPRRYEYTDLGYPSVGFLRDVQQAKDIDQIFIYETIEQKEVQKARLLGDGIMVEDWQFIHISDYNKVVTRLIGEGKIVVTMLSNRLSGHEMVRDPIAGNRLIVGNEDGFDDLMLLDRLALEMAIQEDLTKEEGQRDMKRRIRDLLGKYYLGSEFGEKEIDKLLEERIIIDVSRGIFKIILPPVEPFLKKHLEFLKTTREVIFVAA